MQPHTQQGAMYCVLWHIPPLSIIKKKSVTCASVDLLLARIRHESFFWPCASMSLGRPTPCRRFIPPLTIAGKFSSLLTRGNPKALPLQRYSDPLSACHNILALDSCSDIYSCQYLGHPTCCLRELIVYLPFNLPRTYNVDLLGDDQWYSLHLWLVIMFSMFYSMCVHGLHCVMKKIE